MSGIKRGIFMRYDGTKEIRFFTYSSVNDIDRRWYKYSIFLFLRKLVWEYIHFLNWYNDLFLDDDNLQNSREIIICEKDSRIVGVAILKKTINEQKICTLRVEKDFQKMGIGSKLMEYSFEWLENDKPLITFHKTKQGDFEPLLKRYNFRLDQINEMYYSIFNTELVYNGELPPKKIISDNFEIVENGNRFHYLDFDKCILERKLMHKFEKETLKKERLDIKYLNEY